MQEPEKRVPVVPAARAHVPAWGVADSVFMRRQVQVPEKHGIRLLLAGLPCGSLRDFFWTSMTRKNSPARLHLDTYASSLLA